MSGSFQTLMAKTSSLPIMKLASCGFVLEATSLLVAGTACGASEAGAGALLGGAACPHTAIDRAKHVVAESSPFLRERRLILIIASPLILILVIFSPMLMAS
jgi:hypothetical protein